MIVIGKVVPYVILALVNTLVILLLGTFVFGMPVEGSLWLLGLECLLFVITSLALGILISTRTESQQVAMMISLIALMLPTILLSGFIFPIESMPWPLRWLTNIVPAKWFIIIVKNIMLKGVGVAFVWKESLILLMMAALLIGLSFGGPTALAQEEPRTDQACPPACQPWPAESSSGLAKSSQLWPSSRRSAATASRGRPTTAW